MRNPELLRGLPHQGFVIRDCKIRLPLLEVCNEGFGQFSTPVEVLSVSENRSPNRQPSVLEVVLWGGGFEHTFLAESCAEQLFCVAFRAEQHLMSTVDKFLTDGEGSGSMTSCHANQTVANSHDPPRWPYSGEVISSQPANVQEKFTPSHVSWCRQPTSFPWNRKGSLKPFKTLWRSTKGVQPPAHCLLTDSKGLDTRAFETVKMKCQWGQISN